MSRKIFAFVRFTASVALIGLLSIPGLSQLGLRKALDFDGDQKADYSIFRPDTGVWYVYGTTGNYILGQPWGIANEDRLTPGDYDGDGRGDLAVWRDSEGVWYIINSSNFTYTFATWGVTGDEPVARDYDGDGKTDLAIVRRSGGLMTWWVYKSTGGFFSAAWGVDGDYAVPGDYDGDGSFDLAVQRPGPTLSSPATFYIYGTTAGYFGVPWGISSDYAVPGDYDGDGKTDVAIVREGATATDPLLWAIYRSDGQGSGTIIASWGITGDDFTAQGYYDVDNKTDIAVWRQSTGTFWILNSLDYSVSGVNWGVAGDLPVATYDTH